MVGEFFFLRVKSEEFSVVFVISCSIDFCWFVWDKMKELFVKKYWLLKLVLVLNGNVSESF